MRVKLNISLLPPKKLKYRFKTLPYSHQKKALNKLLKLEGRGALFMEMATGKTKVAIDWAGIGFNNFATRKVLVVAPLSVLGVWPRQIREHSPTPARVIRLSGPTKDRIRLLRQLQKSSKDDLLTFVVINYEGIWREDDHGVSIESLLIKWKPDLIIFDESHRLKNATSKQSRSAYRITKALPKAHKLLLTGTPVTKAPLDVFGQFRSIDDRIFGPNWHQFKNYYGVWGGFGRFQLRGYRHLELLISRVRTWSFRVRKDQCLDLPPKVFLDIPVTLSAKAISLYKQMAEEMIIELEKGVYATASIVLTKLLRLSQITSGFVKDTEGKIRIIDDAKLKTCMDLVRDLVLEEDHKVVIFVRFKSDIERIITELTAEKIQYRKLDGSVPGTVRDSFIEDFQGKPEVKVFVAQIQAGSEGIELYAADVAIYYSMSYSALHYWQSQDRLHRPGQKSDKVMYYRLMAPKTIDEITYKVLEEKGNLAKAVLHDPEILRY